MTTDANTLFKVYINKMPETLNTKKEIDEYIKEFWKDFKENTKGVKIAKTKQKKGIDKDGNVKEKRAPSEYNIFVKEQYSKIKDANTDLDKTQIFSEIAKIWRENKNANENVANKNDVPEVEVEVEVEKNEIIVENKVKDEDKPIDTQNKKQGRKAIAKK